MQVFLSDGPDSTKNDRNTCIFAGIYEGQVILGEKPAFLHLWSFGVAAVRNRILHNVV